MDTLRGLAVVHGVVGLATCVCLILLFLGAAPFGPINDVGNAALGLLSAALSWRYQQSAGKVHSLFVGIAGVGAVVTVIGTILVMTGATGFFLAGLVSAVGFALIGSWLVAVSRKPALTEQLRRAGLVAGLVMVVGIVNAPGVFMGLDILETAPAWTYVGSFGWAGTYLLFPSWSLRLGLATGKIP